MKLMKMQGLWEDLFEDSCGLEMVEKSGWDTHDKGDKFITTAEGVTDLYFRPCYDDLYRILDEQ